MTRVASARASRDEDASWSNQLLRRLCGFVAAGLLLISGSARLVHVSSPTSSSTIPPATGRVATLLRRLPNHSSCARAKRTILWGLYYLVNRGPSVAAVDAPAEPLQTSPQGKRGSHSSSRSSNRQRRSAGTTGTFPPGDRQGTRDSAMMEDIGGADDGRGLVEDGSGNVWLRYVDGQGDVQLYQVPPWVADLPLDRSHRIREAMNSLLEDTLDDIERLLAHLEALSAKDGIDLESDDFVIDEEDDDDDAVVLSSISEFFGVHSELVGEAVEDVGDSDDEDNDDAEDDDAIMEVGDDDDDDYMISASDFGADSADVDDNDDVYQGDDDDGDGDAERNAAVRSDGDEYEFEEFSKARVREPMARVVRFTDYSEDDMYDSFFRDPADWIDTDPTYMHEFDVLTRFLEEVKGSASPELESRFYWLQPEHDYCSWGGIVCEQRPFPVVAGNRTDGNNSTSTDGELTLQPVVVKIELPRAGLSGSIPSSVAELQYLQVLNLAGNRLKGTIPSAAYANLTRTTLRALDLSHNQLTGAIPLFQLLHYPNLFNTTTTARNTSSVVEELLLSFNNFTGTLSQPLPDSANATTSSRSSKKPSTPAAEAVGSMSFDSSLTWLDLSSNRLSGTLPQELFAQLSNLEVLLLGDNLLSGSIPNLRNASSLRLIDVGSNLFNTSISSLMESLPTRIQQVNAGHNILHGTLSKDLWRHRRLELLILSDNQIGGSLPTSKGISGQSADGKTKDVSVTMDGSTSSYQNRSSQSNSYHSLKTLRLWWIARNKIRGQLPSDLFVGLRSPLESLDISYNAFNSTIPTEIGLLSNLFHVDAMGNRLRGTLPTEMLNMNRNLRLNFTNNLCVPGFITWSLTGTIPAMFCGEGQASSSMLYQEFGCDAVLCRPGTFSIFGHATLHSACRPCPKENERKGTTKDGERSPPLSKVLGRTSCEGVDFVHGDLNGDGELSAREILRMLYIDTLGRFWGAEYHTWADMKVPECSLTGVTCVDDQIVKIDLGSANLCSDGDRKPAPLIFCKGLPRELGLLSTLEYLHLTRQKFLRGTLPTEIGKLTKLQLLDLTSCSSMISTLPTELGALTNLRALKVSHTQLHGQIPHSLMELPNLEVLHLTNNKLSGTIPTMRLPSVKELMVARNDLSGSIPSELTTLTNLENFEAYHNRLTGSLPARIGECSSLKRIDLFGNKLTGVLPASLVQLSSLQILHMKDNVLTGTIPQLGNNPMLSWVDLSNNYLHGPIPSSFGTSRVIEDLRLGYNLLHDPIPPGLCSNSRLNGGAAAPPPGTASGSRSSHHPPPASSSSSTTGTVAGGPASSCDHVLCPIGTYSEAGHATESSPCQRCPPGQTTLYLGSSRHACHVVTPERIMSMLFEAMNGDTWPEAFQDHWGDEGVPLCRWAGLTCDDNDDVTSIAFPLRGTEDYMYFH